VTGQAAGLIICAIAAPIAAWQTALGIRDRRREQRHDAFIRDRDGL
jgi:hypothetical protein